MAGPLFDRRAAQGLAKIGSAVLGDHSQDEARGALMAAQTQSAQSTNALAQKKLEVGQIIQDAIDQGIFIESPDGMGIDYDHKDPRAMKTFNHIHALADPWGINLSVFDKAFFNATDNRNKINAEITTKNATAPPIQTEAGKILIPNDVARGFPIRAAKAVAGPNGTPQPDGVDFTQPPDGSDIGGGVTMGANGIMTTPAKPEKLKPLPSNINKMIESDLAAVDSIDGAISAIQSHPNAVGGWSERIPIFNSNLLQNSLIDPGGTEARSLLTDAASVRLHERFGSRLTSAETNFLQQNIPSIGDKPDTAIKKLNILRNAYVNSLSRAAQNYQSLSYEPNASLNDFVERNGPGEPIGQIGKMPDSTTTKAAGSPAPIATPAFKNPTAIPQSRNPSIVEPDALPDPASKEPSNAQSLPATSPLPAAMPSPTPLSQSVGLPTTNQAQQSDRAFLNSPPPAMPAPTPMNQAAGLPGASQLKLDPKNPAHAPIFDKFLQQANGDPGVAESLARQQGYSF